MKTMKVITVSDDLIRQKELEGKKIYLSDMPEFKDGNISVLYNTVFNKMVTGIGGSTLALQSKENIIVLMPFVEVVNNKEDTIENSMIVKGGVTIYEIMQYILNNKVRKIVSTYDGFGKILKAYKRARINIYDDFLLVDEWQVLFQQYPFRYKVINPLLTESLKFTNKCFMTATPIKREYWFKELEDLTELVLHYDLDALVIKHFKSINIVDEALSIIENYKNDDNNLHFFINSVDTIKAVTKIGKIKPEDVRIICSRQDRNANKLVGYKIEGTKDPVKKLNFYTATCFEGCDIMDTKGKIFVLCDGSKAHTLVDISTTLPQIAGRIRDIEDQTINLVYTTTRYMNVNEEEMNQKIAENMRSGKAVLKGAKVVDVIAGMDVNYLNSRYISRDDNNIMKFEQTFVNIDKSNYEISTNYSLKANVTAKLKSKFMAIEVVKPWAEHIERIAEDKNKALSFREKCENYAAALKVKFHEDPTVEKDVKNAVDILGMEKLDQINYHKGDVKALLINKLNISESNKIMKILKLTPGEFYSANTLKNKFTKIYNNLEITKTPRGADVENFYHVKKTTQRVNGISTLGYTIITPLIIFKNN